MPTSNADVLSLIAQAHDENWEELDLSGMGLTELPKEIDRLTGVKVLNLSDNQITEIPESIGQLTNLTELYLYDNQITEIPKRSDN